MKFERNKIIVKSTGRFWRKEFTGKKPYTIRILDKEEYDRLWETVEKYKRLKIVVRKTPVEPGMDYESFSRTVRDVSDLGEILGKFLVGISWKVE